MKLLLLLVLMTSTAYAQNIEMSSFSGGQVTFTGRGFTRPSSVPNENVQILYKWQDIRVQLNENGSFSYTTPKNSISKGDTVRIYVHGYQADSFVIPMSEEDKAEYRRLTRRIQEYAHKEGYHAAQIVARDIGKIIKWKRGLSRGFINSFESYSSKHSSGRSYYQRGYTSGESQGRNKGASNGKSQAISRAKDAAASRVRKAYRAAVDDPARKSLKKLNSKLPEASFNGDKQPESPDSMDDVISSINYELDQDRRNLYLNELSSSDIGEVTVQSIKYNSNGSVDWQNILNSSEAYDRWSRGGLDRHYNSSILKHRLFDQEQLNYLVDVFRSAYNQGMNDYVYSYSSGYDSSASRLGEEYGKRLGSSIVKEEGRVDGYNIQYGPAAEKSFTKNYGATFKKTYSSRVSFYKNNSVIVETSTELKEENDNLLWERGEVLGLRINEIINMGAKTAKLKIQIESNESVDGGKAYFLKLKPLSSLKGKVKNYPAIASIKQDLADENYYKLSARIGDESIEHKFYLGWKNVIKDLKTEIYDASGNGLWEEGEAIGVRIISASNKSRVDADLEVKLRGEGLVYKSMDNFTLDGEKSLQDTKNYQEAARIVKGVAENIKHNIVLSVGPFDIDYSFTVGWLNLVQTYGKTHSETMKQSIVAALKKEWSEAKAKGQYRNWYKKKRNGKPTLLEQLVKEAQKMGVDKFKGLADAGVCKIVKGEYMLIDWYNWAFARSFKKLWKKVDYNCK